MKYLCISLVLLFVIFPAISQEIQLLDIEMLKVMRQKTRWFLWRRR